MGEECEKPIQIHDCIYITQPHQHKQGEMWRRAIKSPSGSISQVLKQEWERLRASPKGSDD